MGCSCDTTMEYRKKTIKAAVILNSFNGVFVPGAAVHG
jgi:hypothetical protein